MHKMVWFRFFLVILAIASIVGISFADERFSLGELQADFDEHPALKQAGFKVKIVEFNRGFLTLKEPPPSQRWTEWERLKYKAEELARRHKEVKDVIWVPTTQDEIVAEKEKALAKAKEDEEKSNEKNKPVSTKNPKVVPKGMVYVPMGCFFMGNGFPGGDPNEKPIHEACLSDFYLDKTEVTQEAYEKATGQNPSYFKNCPKCPVEMVSWDEAKGYCAKVGKRLPTEAEWEYSARSGGKKENWAGTVTDAELGNYAWYVANSQNKTHNVGEKQANGLGLFDMSGNVWEWVNDRYGEDSYQISRKNNPQGPSSGDSRVLRGGSWSLGPDNLRASNRYYNPLGYRDNDVGFRCAQ